MTSTLIRKTFAVLSMLIFASASAIAEVAQPPKALCYDFSSSRTCSTSIFDKDMKLIDANGNPDDAVFRCLGGALPKGVKILKDQPTDKLGYERDEQCGKFQEWDKRLKTWVTILVPGKDLLGDPAMVDAQCGQYYQGKECTRNGL